MKLLALPFIVLMLSLYMLSSEVFSSSQNQETKGLNSMHSEVVLDKNSSLGEEMSEYRRYPRHRYYYRHYYRYPRHHRYRYHHYRYRYNYRYCYGNYYYCHHYRYRQYPWYYGADVNELVKNDSNLQLKDGQKSFNGNDYFIDGNFAHPYSNDAVCDYELIDGNKKEAVLSFYNFTCKNAYDYCAKQRDEYNQRSEDAAFFCDVKRD